MGLSMKNLQDMVFKTTYISPMTREPLQSSYHKCNYMKNIVSEYLKTNPDMKKEQYKKVLTVKSYNEIVNNIDKVDFIDIKSFVDIIKLAKNITIKIVDKIEDIKNINHELLRNICRYSSFEIFKHIINKGIDLEKEDSTKNRLIHSVCDVGSVNMFGYLVDKGVNLECKNSEGMRPIHVICNTNTNIKVTSMKLKYMNNRLLKLKYIIDKVDLECEDNDNWRPIHYVSKYGSLAMLKCLIDKGVNLECGTNYGDFPLHLICDREKSFRLCEYIINKGVNLECENTAKYRPIHIAILATKTSIQTVKLLIDKGVNLECQCEYSDRPIHIACRENLCDVIKLLIDKGVNLECENDDHQTPIQIICRYGSAEALKLLISKGVKLSGDLHNLINENEKHRSEIIKQCLRLIHERVYE